MVDYFSAMYHKAGGKAFSLHSVREMKISMEAQESYHASCAHSWRSLFSPWGLSSAAGFFVIESIWGYRIIYGKFPHTETWHWNFQSHSKHFSFFLAFRVTDSILPTLSHFRLKAHVSEKIKIIIKKKVAKVIKKDILSNTVTKSYRTERE